MSANLAGIQTDSTYSLGRQGEQFVAEKYQQNGHIILVQNYEYRATGRSGRLGEIDLLTLKDNCLHLVEVKMRNSGSLFLEGLVTRKKLNFLANTLKYFLKSEMGRGYSKLPAVFDLAIVQNGQIQIIPNAAVFDSIG